MTRDTEKVFVIIYSEYLRRRSFGTAKNQAVRFEDSKLRAIEAFSDLDSEDIRYSLEELKECGYISMDILGDIEILRSGSKYMESKPKEFFSAFAGTIKGIVELIGAFL